MKRIQNACLLQTFRFFCMDDTLSRPEAAAAARAEVAQYKAKLDKEGVKYRVDAETGMEDGSIILRIRRQYLNHTCGRYLDE